MLCCVVLLLYTSTELEQCKNGMIGFMIESNQNINNNNWKLDVVRFVIKINMLNIKPNNN